jgi:PAS domain S-box-containing protein/diguanylate cyclase (GGDEF)-like protein
MTVTGQQRKGDIVSDETLSRARLPRRIEFLTRQHGLLEASVPMAEGQALAPYLNSRSAGVELADVTVVATGETHEKLVLRQADVIHARPLEAHVPVVRAQPEGGEDVALEVTLGSGDVVRGSFIMAPGQTIGEHLGSSGTFAVLTKARADGRSAPPTDLAVNQYAMQRIRDVGETPTRCEWQRGGTAAPAARADWLLRAAREQGVAGCDGTRAEVAAEGQATADASAKSAAEVAREAEVREERGRQSRRRSEMTRALMLGLDRCVADGGGMADVVGFAGDQLASAFDSPLVWIATLEDGAPEICAWAGSCAPYVRSARPRWDTERNADGAVAAATRTGAPQGTRIDDEPAFEAWREHLRARGAPLLLVVPMLVDGAAVGVIGMHTRNMQWLDRDSGAELLAASERIGSVVQRLRRLEAMNVQLSAFEHAADAVFLTDREGVIQWVNRAFVELSGYQPEEAIGRRPNILRSDLQDAGFFRGVWETILAGSLWRGELYNQHSDGSTYAVEQTITPVLNRDRVVTHFLSVQRDITERKQRESRVHQLLTRDPMSGLPNGRAFEGELQNAVAAVAKGGAPAALLLIQAEGVAASANATTHDDAEALARLLATTLRSTLRPEDTLARLGDFEFAALLPDTTADGAVVAAERLRAAATARFAEDAQGRGIVRLGIAPIDGSHGARAVLAVADAALYGEHNEATDIIARVSANAASGIAAEWAERIRAAVRGGLFFLHYQPVVRLSTGVVAHYDGLLRLHDERGQVMPARAFITHAESLGLMPEIDRWVVEHVMRLLQDSPDLCVSLNVSGATIASAGFRQFVQRQSRRMAAVGARMIFEVDEVASVEELPRLVDGMNHLRELGCRFTLDNFSLTDASVASLGALPVDHAKLDRSLVTGIDVDENRFELTRALTAVARALGREVIAGCAERAGIVDVLPELGIDMAQGHYFGAPSAELRGHVGGNGRTADALLLATAGNATPVSN